MDMLSITLKAMGVDPTQLFSQAMALGTAFEKIAQQQAETLRQLEQIRQSQDAIMSAMGLYVAPPEGEIAALIAVESHKLIERHGGAISQAELDDTRAELIGV